MFNNLIGQTLGKYELRALLGAGGMGAVYRAYDHGLQREVAVKVINLGANNTDLQGRFIREARTAAALEHSHIVRVYDYGVERDINYIVMQHLTGGALSDRMKQAAEDGRSRASLPEVALLLEQLASALDYAHFQGVIHRDIKPQNVMFNNQGQAFIVDFGIAKLLTGATNMTGTGLAMGTPSYMSPEQWQTDGIVPASDQYALAVMIYQLIAGRLPFEADTPMRVMYRHLNDQPTPLSNFRPDIPPGLLLVMDRAMAKDPEQRFPNCTQYAQAFGSAVSGVNAGKTDYFTFKLARIRPSGMPYTPTPNQPAYDSPAPSSRLSLPAMPLTKPAPKFSRNLLIGGAGTLTIIGVLAVLLLSTREPLDSDMRLTEVTKTLIAGGLATDRVETREAGLELIPTYTAETALSLEFTKTASNALSLSSTDTNVMTSIATNMLIHTAAPTAIVPGSDVVIQAPANAETEVASRLGATATAQTYLNLTATVEAVLQAAQTSTRQAEESQVARATQTEAAIQTAVQRSVFATMTEQQRPAIETQQMAASQAVRATRTAAAVQTEVQRPAMETQQMAASQAVRATQTAAAVQTEVQHVVMATQRAQEVTATAHQVATLVVVEPRGITTIRRNSDWTPIEMEFGEATMVLVPAGCFMMGGENSSWAYEQPVHEQCFDVPFWIDKTEVTNAQYQRDSDDMRPVDQIDWFEANAYCQQRGGRLPTEAEWEYAARGPESWTYPWGDTYVEENAVHNTRSVRAQITSVGSLPHGASWIGAYDMSGNVYEWTSSLYERYPYNASDGREADISTSTNDARVLRGGSALTYVPDIPTYRRRGYSSQLTARGFGFRCARSTEHRVTTWLSTETPTEEPTVEPTATTVVTSVANSPIANVQLFEISQDESQVLFLLDEDLMGSTNTVIGTTDQIAGFIRVNFATPQESVVGPIEINLRTLQTDNEFRNRAIRDQILESNRDEYEFTTFTPTSIVDLPTSIEIGKTIRFTVIGDLPIRNITNSTEWEIQVTLVSRTRLEGRARTTITRSAYGIEIPNVAHVANVEDEIDLAIEFVAVAVE